MSSFTAGPPSVHQREPVAGAGHPLPSEDPDAPDRQCGRCRQHFDVEPPQVAVQEWWLCAPCHTALFG